MAAAAAAAASSAAATRDQASTTGADVGGAKAAAAAQWRGSGILGRQEEVLQPEPALPATNLVAVAALLASTCWCVILDMLGTQ